MLEGKSLTICMFKSSAKALLEEFEGDWKTTIGQLEIGLLKDGTWVVFNKNLEDSYDIKLADISWLKEALVCAKQNNLKPILYVNHETIKYTAHENHMIIYNILELLDEICIDVGIEKFYLIDAGFNFNLDKTYKTKFEKFVANTWLVSCKKHPLDIDEWVRHDRFGELHDRKHILTDLRFVEYPICNLMSRAKDNRLAFYIEAKRLGFWDNNPNCTINDFGQSDEVARARKMGIPNIYWDDEFAIDIIKSFKNRKQELAPAEMHMDIEKNYPPELGMRMPFATKTYQSSFFIMSAESEIHGDSMFITEKTILPILNLQPVNIIGQKGINAYMESLGFDMFKDIIDYDLYDQIDDPVERAIKQTHVVYDSVIKNFNEVLDHWKKHEATLHERLYRNYLRLAKFIELMNENLILQPSNIIETSQLNSKNIQKWLGA